MYKIKNNQIFSIGREDEKNHLPNKSTPNNALSITPQIKIGERPLSPKIQFEITL